jgi:hypothetical protein
MLREQCLIYMRDRPRWVFTAVVVDAHGMIERWTKFSIGQGALGYETAEEIEEHMISDSYRVMSRELVG